MLARAVLLYGAQPDSILAIFVATAALVVGCFVFAVVTTPSSNGFFDFVGWILGGAVALDFMVLLVAFVGGPMDAGDQLLYQSLYFWGFWTLIGGITGFAYWMISRGL
jgi:hypothetical protein